MQSKLRKPTSLSKRRVYALICCCLGKLLLFAAPGYGQSIHEVKISVTFEDVPVLKALREIENKTPFIFAYDKGVKQLEQRIHHEYDQNTVAEVLRDISKETSIMFHQVNRTIVSKLKKPESKGESKAVDQRQKRQLARTVTGKVTDENGEPLVGATVVVKVPEDIEYQGTMGAITDVEGRFAFTIQEDLIDQVGAIILLVSYVGYESEEVQLGNRSVIDIALLPSLESLSEVQVVSTGYYKVEQRLNPGNIARVDAEVIGRQPIANPLQALQGRVAGLQIQQMTGVPGGEVNINIRGVNSLNNGQRIGGETLPNANLPFFVIDGVPYINQTVSDGQFDFLPMGNGNPLNFIQPNDIESIQILKDADATAIYGSRGANGVILITTKQGQPGKTTVGVNLSRGWGEVANKVDLLNTEQWLEMRREGLRNDNAEPTEQIYPDLLVWDTTRYTDWQEELIGGLAEFTNTTFEITGGTAQTQFLFQGSYFSQGNVYAFDDSKFQRGSGLIRINHTSNDQRLQINSSFNYIHSFNNQNGVDLTKTSLQLAPNAPALFDSVGNLNFENSSWDNPIAELRREYENTTKNLIANATLSYRISDKLTFRTSLGHTSTFTDEIRTSPHSSFDPAARNFGSLSISNSQSETWIAEPQLDFTQPIAKGVLIFAIGGSFQGNQQSLEGFAGRGYQSDALLRDIFAADVIFVQSTTDLQYRYIAGYGRLNYVWDDKYVINLTGRRDGSSRFGPGRQFGNFGSIGVSWIFSEETIVESALPFLSFGKLRGSYGSVGSDNIGDYRFLSSFTSFDPYGGQQALIPTRSANLEYSWETTTKLEFGLDLGFFENRAQLTTSWYRNQTTDQLIGRPLNATTGFNTQQFNLPAVVENRGWEFEISTVNIQTEDFTWRTDFNLSLPENELVEFPNIEEFPEFDAVYEVGQPILGRKQFKPLGVNPETGVYDFVDVNADGFINSLDAQLFVANAQDFFGGLGNSFQYKGFRLDIFFQFVGQDVPAFANLWQSPSSPNIATTQILDRWQNPGDITDTQKFTNTENQADVRNDATNFEDGSFIRLQNASLSWNLPSNWLQSARLQNARIFVQGQNLLTITDYSGLDPEALGTSLPPLRVVSVGFDVRL